MLSGEFRTPPPGLDPARLRPALRLALAAVAVALGVLGVTARASSFGTADVARNEFTQDWVSARAMNDSVDPYANSQALMDRYLPGQRAYVLRNPHLPAQILLTRPLSLLPYRPARAIWLVIQALAIAIGVGVVARELGWTRSTASVVGVGLLALPIVQKELLYGNLNGLLLLLAALAWRSLRRGSDITAGVLVGVAAVVKLYPLFLFIPIIRLRRKAAVRWGALSIAVMGGASVLAAGISNVNGFWSSLTENGRYWRSAPINVSLVSVPYRWLTQSVWRHGGISRPFLATLVAGAVVLGCFVAGSLTPAARSGDVFWAAVPWMILVSPLAWDWYLVLAVPTAMAMVATAARTARMGLLAILTLALLAIGAPPGLPQPRAGLSVGALVLGYGMPTVALVLTGVVDFFHEDHELSANTSRLHARSS